jgi:hypothetical protein
LVFINAACGVIAELPVLTVGFLSHALSIKQTYIVVAVGEAALEKKDIQYGDVDIPEEDFKKAEEDLKR